MPVSCRMSAHANKDEIEARKEHGRVSHFGGRGVGRDYAPALSAARACYAGPSQSSPHACTRGGGRGLCITMSMGIGDTLLKRYLPLLLLHCHTFCHAVPLTADSLALEATGCTKLKFHSAPLQGTPATAGADFIDAVHAQVPDDQGHLVFQTYLDR
jgi:hypothetical protein